jgi:hypothetical protein
MYRFRVIVVMCPIEKDYWTDPKIQQGLVAAWQWVAQQLKFFPALQAYDILNEPVGNRYDLEQKTHWLSIAQVICTALRAADSRTPIMVEPCWWGLPGSFWQTKPVKVTGLVYSFHFYEPHAYTHQGLDGRVAPVELPPDSGIDDVLEARTFAALHSVPMFVGEFAALRWAPESEEYLRRAVLLFKSQQWGWTYHCWRAWEGWDAEIPSSVPAWSGSSQDRRSDSPSISLLKWSMVGAAD